MKTWLEYLDEGKKKKKEKQYAGTAVLVSHGSHSQPKKGKILKEKHEGIQKINHWIKDADADNAHLGPTPEHVHKHLEKAHPFKEIPHKEAFKDYTQFSYDLNHSLLHHYNRGEEHPDQLGPHSLKKLDAAVGHHELKHDLHVYSGVGFHPGEEAAKDPENKLHLPAYTSSSIERRQSTTFKRPVRDKNRVDAEHVIHLHLKPGQKGVYVGSNSEFDHEKEYVLPRHTTIKIHPTPTKISASKDDPIDTYVWHGHVVPNEPAAKGTAKSNQKQIHLKESKKKALPKKFKGTAVLVSHGSHSKPKTKKS